MIAARHPGAARGAVALARGAHGRDIDVEFLATEPAFSMLATTMRERVYTFATAKRRYPALPTYDGPERIENDDLRNGAPAAAALGSMAAWLHRYLGESKPDAVVMTDANEQLGVEQVIAVPAGQLGIPSVRVRDSWGTATGVETNATRGILPEPWRASAVATGYFEIDRRGAELSVNRLGIPEDRLVVLNGLYTLDTVVGSVTEESYAAARAAVGAAPDEPLIVYFAQPTRGEYAELQAFDAFVTELNRAGLGEQGVVLATQEHPREADPRDGLFGLNWAARHAATAYRGKVINLTPKILIEKSVRFEQTMQAADVFASSYSNSSIEATALGATATSAMPTRRRAVGFHVLCPGVVRYALGERRAGLRIVPFAENGALPCAERVEDIGPLMSALLFSPDTRLTYFDAMRERYNLGRCAADVVERVARLIA